MHIWDLYSEVAFIEGWPHLRGGLYEGFHCTYCNGEGGVVDNGMQLYSLDRPFFFLLLALAVVKIY